MTDWIIIVGTLVGLAVGGHLFIVGAAAVGQRCGMSPVLVGATIVAFGTSLPEWAVSVVAAWQGHTALSAGNVVGSNVFNVCLILGLAAVLFPLPVTRDSLTHDGVLMLLATALFLAVTFGGLITRIEGILLLVVGCISTGYFLVTRRGEADDRRPYHWWEFPRAVCGLVLVLLSSHFFVVAAESVARRQGISDWTIGITVAAIGTSLPELVTALAAVAHRHGGMVIGNVLGSNAFNILFVLGTASCIRPVEIAHFSVWQAATFGGLMLVVFALLASAMRLARWEGILLFVLGLAWYAFDLAM